MRTETQEKLLKILFKALKPLVHMLLESGIGHREFSQIAKMAFVDVATRNYGIRGRDTNISRVAVMTGLTRKEVKRVRDGLGDEMQQPELRPLPASSVLHQWFFDRNFVDDKGQPRILDFEYGNNSFKDLVKKYAGDIPPGAIRTELKRTGAIKIDPDGKLRALRPDYQPRKGDDQVLRAFERPLTALLMNLKRNVVDSGGENTRIKPWPERIVEVWDVDARKLPKVLDFSSEYIRDSSAELDVKLSEFRDKDPQTPGTKSDKVTIGVGLYYFQL